LVRCLLAVAIFAILAPGMDGIGQASAAPMSHHGIPVATYGAVSALVGEAGADGLDCGQTRGGSACCGHAQSCAQHCGFTAAGTPAPIVPDGHAQAVGDGTVRRSLEPPSVFRPPRVA
jgi:hypothetical protein